MTKLSKGVRELEKKQYEKPKVIHQEMLEAVAGACTQPPVGGGYVGKAPMSACTWISS